MTSHPYNLSPQVGNYSVVFIVPMERSVDPPRGIKTEAWNYLMARFKNILEDDTENVTLEQSEQGSVTPKVFRSGRLIFTLRVRCSTVRAPHRPGCACRECFRRPVVPCWLEG